CHTTICSRQAAVVPDKKGQFIAIYRGFLLSLKDK
ncbi:TPA: tetracyline resistance-associated transcriptional repressor TetC, partial [Escherichia coli]